MSSQSHSSSDACPSEQGCCHQLTPRLLCRGHAVALLYGGQCSMISGRPLPYATKCVVLPLVRDQLLGGARLAFRTLEWSCPSFDRTICPTSWRSDRESVAAEFFPKTPSVWYAIARERWECVGYTIGQKHWAFSFSRQSTFPSRYHDMLL